MITNSDILDKNVRFFNLETSGKGGAVKFGIDNSTFENLIIYDSDFSYDYNLILKFFSNKKELGAFCYANRKITKNIFQNTKILRLIAGFVFNKLIRFYLNIESADTQAGLKLINKSIFKNVNEFISVNYMYDVELFLLAKKINIKPISINVQDINTAENSNINLLSDSLDMFMSLKKIKNHHQD